MKNRFSMTLIIFILAIQIYSLQTFQFELSLFSIRYFALIKYYHLFLCFWHTNTCVVFSDTYIFYDDFVPEIYPLWWQKAIKLTIKAVNTKHSFTILELTSAAVNTQTVKRLFSPQHQTSIQNFHLIHTTVEQKQWQKEIQKTHHTNVKCCLFPNLSCSVFVIFICKSRSKCIRSRQLNRRLVDDNRAFIFWNSWFNILLTVFYVYKKLLFYSVIWYLLLYLCVFAVWWSHKQTFEEFSSRRSAYTLKIWWKMTGKVRKSNTLWLHSYSRTC